MAQHRIIKRIFRDILIYYISFKTLQFIKYNELFFFNSAFYYFVVIICAVLISSFLTDKYRLRTSSQIIELTRPNFNSLIFALGLVTFYFNIFLKSTPSRILVSGTILTGFFVELIIQFLKYRITFSKKSFSINKFSEFAFIYEFLVLAWTTFYPYYAFSSVSFQEDKFAILILLFIWLITGIFVHQFRPPRSKRNYWHFIWTRIKTYILMIALTSFTVYLLIPEGLSSIYPLYISIVFTFSAVITNTFYYIVGYRSKSDEVSTRIVRATESLEEPLLNNFESFNGKYALKNGSPDNRLNANLTKTYLKNLSELSAFLNESLDINSFNYDKSIMIKSSEKYNIDVMPDNDIEFYLNLHKLNDFRRINEYLITVNEKLVSGGVFVGAVETLSHRRKKFYKSYPFYFASIFYFFDFIWKRVMPKLPIFTRFYFGLTKGKNRAVSLSEIFGRITYCGFDLIKCTEIPNLNYFIAIKRRCPLADGSPSYGPFIKLKRVGLNGNIIYVYKFRTMYPYSEYLQSYVYSSMGTSTGDKFDNDFRVTGWGRKFRELWIDELPMLINLLRGDLKLVGVRPLSIQKFNIYPKHLQERRIKYKPGLIPPFYADLPQNQEEFFEAEERYLDNYEKHPLITDLKYFFKASYNILIRHARSK